MKISLVDVDGHNFPNLALMKISAFHKAQGDDVDWYMPLFSHPDKIYASKVFTFTRDFTQYALTDPNPVKGGTGYDCKISLPDEIETMLPDYSIYPKFKEAYGFLSRGCIRNCPWCIVPSKEGTIRQVDDIERISQGRRNIVLMDNNFLANQKEFVTEQLEKSRKMNFRIDFNQGLDARLVNEENASLLASVKWMHYIRFSCDTMEMLEPIKRAVGLIRRFSYTGEFFIYVLAQNVDEALERINRLCAIDKRITPFCQPYRDFSNNDLPDIRLRRLARWCNIASIRKTIPFKEYKYQ